MKGNSASKERGKLENVMSAVFGDKINNLSTEMQKILIDDMVTAFESKLAVFSRLAPRNITILASEDMILV
jgi:hypothetical protein